MTEMFCLVILEAKVQDQGVNRVDFFQGLWGKDLFQASSSCVFTFSALCACLSLYPNFVFIWEHQSYWIRAHPHTSSYFCLQWPHFQIRLYLEIQGVRFNIQIFGGHNSTHSNWQGSTAQWVIHLWKLLLWIRTRPKDFICQMKNRASRRH